ncbi:MAG: bifunctional phosphoribosylaminoimidazolecarboxamide formyltransferase/IMP cyclohydrolase [Maricaulaceae bacterium]
MTEPARGDNRRPIRRALISVSDKSDLVRQARALAAHGVMLLSTGGTRTALAEAGLAVEDVASVTQWPEMMDGRVKTLHPRIHGGLLGRRDRADDQAVMAQHGVPEIDLLIVNLYPFEATLAAGADFDTCVETIDIGGPALIRAAAKNHQFVTVCVDAEDVDAVLTAFDSEGGVPGDLRRRLAGKAYARTAAYDAAIAAWLDQSPLDADTAPARITLGGSLASRLRYGENPHQNAAFYRTGSTRPGVATARQVQGKALSYNNLNDTDAAFELVAEFDPSDRAAVAIIKHANPCGVALGADLAEAHAHALACDPVSAFGGVVAVNRRLDAAAARAITAIFTEVVIAPDADADTLAIFATKKNLRLLLTGDLPDPTAPGRTVKTLAGGFLVQTRDKGAVSASDLRIVTQAQPSASQIADGLFAWRVAKHVKSNAIVYAKDQATAGVGAGQMSRVDAARIAAQKAQDAAAAAGWTSPRTQGSACASDAFFPFPDGLLQAAEAGAVFIIQPGGSVRDADVIAAADEAGLAMAFTGMRHFRH